MDLLEVLGLSPPADDNAVCFEIYKYPCADVRYGDNVEDEWFVVWLLMELTRQLEGLCARAWDDDGEFLLIEAAYSLPRWLKPETSTNRVWLHGGHLHVMPPPSRSSPTLPAAPSVQQALQIVTSPQLDTHQHRVEAAVLERLSGYPGRARQQLQRVTAWLPWRVALLLQEDPQLVAAAVAAFMTRQREDVQAASKLFNFPPSEMTTALVSLNRCMYAQLMQAEYAAPRGWPQQHPAGAAGAGEWLGGSSARQLKALSMGLKITTGMEIMCLRLGIAGARKQAGYFQQELEGSAKYRQLLAAAQESDDDAAGEDQEEEEEEEDGLSLGGDSESSEAAGSSEDVDFNLIKSMVASYTAQGGLPGPASNLAGLLGLQLPTEVAEDK
eukprot:gene6594-6822_t